MKKLSAGDLVDFAALRKSREANHAAVRRAAVQELETRIGNLGSLPGGTRANKALNHSWLKRFFGEECNPVTALFLAADVAVSRMSGDLPEIAAGTALEIAIKQQSDIVKALKVDLREIEKLRVEFAEGGDEASKLLDDEEAVVNDQLRFFNRVHRYART